MSRHRRPIEEIAPDDFLSTWGASSYSEGIEKAEQAPTTTPDEELPRCPECGTRRVYPRGTNGTAGQDREFDTDYVCHDRHHFDDPVYGVPFEWVDPADLEEPPLRRQLAELDDRRLAALVIYLYRPWEDAGPSYRDLESVVPYSSDWVGARVRAWKDGEFRDLVADPRPWRVDE